MASARRTGVNENISTLKSSGGDYTDPAVWESDTDINLVSATQSEVLECDAGTYNVAVILAGATTSASYFRIVRPAAGAFHDGTPDTGVIFDGGAVKGPFQIQEANSSFQDLVGTSAITDSIEYPVWWCSTFSAGADMVGCIADSPTNAGAGFTTGLRSDTSAKVIDCISINPDGRGFLAVGSAAQFLNCTSVGAGGAGFWAHNGTTVAKNCLATGSTGNDFDDNGATGTWTGNNNASEDGTAPGTSSRTSQTFTFANAGDKDYHLDLDDAGAKGYGADLSGSFTDDIDRENIIRWSIGADAQAAERSSGRTALDRRMRKRRLMLLEEAA